MSTSTTGATSPLAATATEPEPSESAAKKQKTSDERVSFVIPTGDTFEISRAAILCEFFKDGLLRRLVESELPTERDANGAIKLGVQCSRDAFRRCRESVAPAPEGGGSGVWSLRGVRVDLCRTVRVAQVLLVGEAGCRRNGEQQRGRRSRSGGGKARRGARAAGFRRAYHAFFLVLSSARHLNKGKVCEEEEGERPRAGACGRSIRLCRTKAR